MNVYILFAQPSKVSFNNIYHQQIRTFESLEIFVIYLHICTFAIFLVFSIYLDFNNVKTR
jgi:hypothetical protein